MNSLSIFSLIAAALELSVPIYGLLLIRRFGSRSVGRFLVWAFCALALLHLVQCLKSNAFGLPNLDLVVAFACGLLLIGLGHLQGLYNQRRQSEFEGQKLFADCQLTLQEKTADLAGSNQQLLSEITRLREHERLLRQSERQYRFLFAENPQAQWIFDLRSLKVLAVNQAALALFGFTSEEFTGLSARRLLQPDIVGFFLRDIAGPCPKAQSRGRWPFCTKDGRRIEADTSAIDLNYDGCPARLLAAIPLIELSCPVSEQPQVNIVSQAPQIEPVSEPPKMDTVAEPRRNAAPAVELATPIMESQQLVVPKSSEPASSQQTQTTVPAASRPIPSTLAEVSLGVGNSTPAKLVKSAPKLSDPSRTAAVKQPDSRHVQAAPVAPKAAPRRSASGKQTILLVDPEAKSRGLARFILSREGYRVIETDCASTVLALWESESIGVDVVVTDVSLPEGVSGTTLVDQLRQTKPELKAVYTSAPTETESEDELINQNIIPKPYTAERLLEAVKNCLVRDEELSCAIA